jgi:preprotein translocase subunit SecG
LKSGLSRYRSFSIQLLVRLLVLSLETEVDLSRTNAVLLAEVTWYSSVLNLIVLATGLFLILLVLIQRGKGGGLSGAFGGVGGSSAFGSRAGDTFTRITIGVAAFWILLTMVQVKVIQSTSERDTSLGTFGSSSAP